jgi:hypothetical protein
VLLKRAVGMQSPRLRCVDFADSLHEGLLPR